MTIASGTRLGRYEIKSPLGAGGMGEVYLAEDTQLGRQVALKFLPAQAVQSADNLRRFQLEARAASRLNHPNIAHIYEISEDEGVHFIAMEYVEGQSLAGKIGGHPLPLPDVVRTGAQIADALDEAHARGIIHRDIKPDNVMVRANGLVKILDFGIAKLSGSNNQPGLDAEAATAIKSGTTPGMIIGTANYMSPEQAKGKEVDARTDIFSFGVVLYEMISGGLPFEGETALEMIGAILKDEPKPLDNSDVSPEIKKIIGKCLRKDRDERYQTIKDVLNDLKDVKQELEIQNKLERTVSPDKPEPKTQILPATTVDETNQTTTNQTVTSDPKKKYLAIGLTVLLLSAIGFFAYRYFTPSKQIESIAVMPFVNESGNADVEYLSDGMTETLIKSLSQLPNLSVKSRSTIFYYKGKETSPKKIGEELNVQAVLLGRVVQRGNDLKLNLELVNTNTQDVIWSEQYDRKQSDLVSLQSEIAKDVSSKLKLKLSGADEAKVTKTSTTNPEAYQAYLKGRYYWNRRTAENIKKAIEQFKAATDRDPNYALAYVGLADCYVLLPEYAGTPTGETAPQARTYAERAIALDEQLGEPHASLGMLNQKLWQWTESEREFKRAIELSPNYATAYQWYSILLRVLGRFDEAAVMIKRAHELDPLSSVISDNLSEVYQIQNDHKSSIENNLKMIELDPNYLASYQQLGISYLKQGRNAEAIASFEKEVELSNRDDFAPIDLGYGYGVTGKRAEATAIAKELEEKYARKELQGQYVAIVYAGLGDKDKAFEWLEKDFQTRNGELGNIRWRIPFEPLRDDPRYKDLLKRMGLPE